MMKTAHLPKLRLALATLLLLLAASVPASAQESVLFGDVIDIRVINVEAVVTARGERVHGLERKDFRLLVDGKEMPAQFFSEAGAPGARPPGVSYLVFLDDFFSISSRRDPALERLRTSLARLQPDDRMAIVAYDGRQLEVLCRPTGDRLELQRVLAEAKKRPAYGLQRRSEASRSFALLRQLHRTSGGSLTGIGFDGSGRSRLLDLEPVQEIFSKVARLQAAAASALRGFQGGDGRKVLLLFSGGIPVSQTDSSIFHDPLRRELVPFLRADSLYGTLLEAANRLGYTVYPIDLGANPVAGLTSAESATIYEQENRRAAAFENERLNEDLLFQLADETGGLPIFDGARLPVLEQVQDDLSSYYWLGFKPTWQGDDRQHEVKIEVLRKGVKVRSRRSFADLSRQAQLDLQVQSAHLFDAPLPIDASFAIRASEAKPDGLGRMMVPVVFEIPVDQLTWVREGEENVAHFELRISATDDLGNSADLPLETVELRLGGEIQRGQKTLYQAGLKLRRRPHRLLVTLYDPPSGHLLAQKIYLRP